MKTLSRFLVVVLFCVMFLSADAKLSYYPATSVPEAYSGFKFPLPYNFSNNGGWEWLDKDYYTYSFVVYHPGEDWNVPYYPGGAGNGDKGLRVESVANGKVVYVNGSNWSGVVIQHNYKGETWFSHYGHVQNISVHVGDNISKGQKIAEIGNVGTYNAHLHFEIRTESHPDPANGNYWEAILSSKPAVEAVYRNPTSFINSHSSYSSADNVLYQDNFTNQVQSFWRYFYGSWYVNNDDKLRQYYRYGSAYVNTPNISMYGYNYFSVEVEAEITYSYRGDGLIYVYFPGGYIRLDDEDNELKIRSYGSSSRYYNYNVRTHQIYSISIQYNSYIMKVKINGNIFYVSAPGIYNSPVKLKTRYAKAEFDNFKVTVSTNPQLKSNNNNIQLTKPLRIEEDEDYKEASDYLLYNENLEIDEDLFISNYPNPFNKSTTIKFISPESGVAKLDIMNILGEVVYSSSKEVFKDDDEYFIWNVEEVLPDGMYIVKVSIGDAIKTINIVYSK